MHNNYYFLKSLSPALEKQLSGASLVECFSQEKDELILQFDNKFNIKAHLESGFCCLAFPRQYHKARHNRIDLFTQLTGSRVKSVHQYRNERSFLLEFECPEALLFKMHGNNSNILLVKDDLVVDLFKNSLKNDHKIIPSGLDRPLQHTYEAFKEEGTRKIFPTFDKSIIAELEDRGFRDDGSMASWAILQNLVSELEDGRFYVAKSGGRTIFTLFDSTDTVETFTDPIKAVDSFYGIRIRERNLQQIRSPYLSYLRQQIKKTLNFLKKTKGQLDRLEHEKNYQHWGDNLMANLHNIKPGSDRVTLRDVYTGEPVTIKLNPSLSIQKNAERFYNKHKNQHKEESRIRKALKTKQHALKKLEKLANEIEDADSVQQVRSIAEAGKISLSPDNREERNLPFWEREIDGFRILIGRNAKANDRLLREYSWKEDLWLHAKDVPGSHVLIKYQSNRPFPAYVKEKAAQFAAWFSKRRTETLSPVIITPRKFVRKRKGDPAGTVVVEREEVLLVEPSEN